MLLRTGSSEALDRLSQEPRHGRLHALVRLPRTQHFGWSNSLRRYVTPPFHRESVQYLWLQDLAQPERAPEQCERVPPETGVGVSPKTQPIEPPKPRRDRILSDKFRGKRQNILTLQHSKLCSS